MLWVNISQVYDIVRDVRYQWQQLFFTCSKVAEREGDETFLCYCLEMGYFYCLPNEILYFILSFLPIQDIISISLTSSKMNSAIKLFAFSPPGTKQLLPDMSSMIEQGGHFLSQVSLGDENSYEIVHPSEQSHAGLCDTVQKFEGLGERGL